MLPFTFQIHTDTILSATGPEWLQIGQIWLRNNLFEQENRVGLRAVAVKRRRGRKGRWK
jgi:hypothetical protein